MDSLYVLYVDTSSNANDSVTERLINTSDMIITLGDEELPVEAGIFGIHLENYFMPGIANPDNDIYYPTGQTPSDLLSALAPKTIRYPGGSSSKFMHALGSMNSDNPDNDFQNQKNGGYGINIEEVIDFYDKSFDGM